MGEKAVGLFMHLTVDCVIVGISLVTMIGYFVPYADPERFSLMPFLGLGLPLLLILNLCAVVWFIWKRRFWMVLFPFLAFAVNYNYITGVLNMSMSQNSFSEPTIKIMTLNIGAASNYKQLITSKLNGCVLDQKVNIICFQEFQSIEGTIRTDSLLSEYPHILVPFKNNPHKLQLAVFSQYPIVRWDTIPFTNTSNSGMWCDCLVDGREIRVFNIHMQTTHITQNHALVQRIKTGDTEAAGTLQNTIYKNFILRAQQARRVSELVEATTIPTLVCGDFNDTPISYTYNTIRGTRLEDGFKRCGNGYEYTFRGLRHLLRIDYILYSQGIHPVDYYSLSETWSDHNPVFMEFTLSAK